MTGLPDQQTFCEIPFHQRQPLQNLIRHYLADKILAPGPFKSTVAKMPPSVSVKYFIGDIWLVHTVLCLSRERATRANGNFVCLVQTGSGFRASAALSHLRYLGGRRQPLLSVLLGRPGFSHRAVVRYLWQTFRLRSRQ